MSDKMRWRYGDTNPVVAAVDSATVIELGDFLWQDTDDAKPPSVLILPQSWNDGSAEVASGIEPPDGLSDEPADGILQDIFADSFLGVAMERSRNGDTAPVRVATTGVFEFDCPSGTFELGDLIGVSDYDRSGCQGLQNQQVTKVTEIIYAIARVARREPNATISVLVDIRSRIMGISI